MLISPQVYLVDRTIAISTGSPVCVSNEHITTIFPGNESNTATETCIPLGRPNAKHFLTQLQLCRLQSEIYEIKFFDRAIPDQFSTPADWVRDMEERIQDVRNRSVSTDGELPQWIANAAYLSQNLLHRPYPGDMEPNGPSVLAATTSAINLINGYHKTSQTARLMQTFSMVDNAFQAAIVLLYIFGNYASIVREASLEKELVGAIDNLMVILVSIEEFIPQKTPRLTSQGCRYTKMACDSHYQYLHQRPPGCGILESGRTGRLGSRHQASQRARIITIPASHSKYLSVKYRDPTRFQTCAACTDRRFRNGLFG
jgi:hypothetical protein